MSAPGFGLSKRDILVFLFKWKGSIFGWAIFTIFLVTTLAYLLPQLYLATAKVVIERNREPTLRSNFAAGLESIEVTNNEIEIIRSRRVMTAVVDAIEPHERPSSDSEFKRAIRSVKTWLSDTGLLPELTPRQSWIETLLRAVKADPVVNSNVLEISYYDEEPEWAARVVNAVTDKYIGRHLEVYSSRGELDFYRAQVEAAESELERLRQKVLAYKQSQSISAMAARRTELARELTSTRELLAEVRGARDELLTRFEAAHPQVTLEDRRIASVRARESEIQRRLEELEQQQSELEAFEVQLRAQEVTFLELKRNHEAARLSAAANSDIINVRLLEYATPPVRPRFPRILFVLLSIPLGFALSISVALLREYMDHRVSDPDTAEAALGVPCYGSVLRFRFWNLRRLG